MESGVGTTHDALSSSRIIKALSTSTYLARKTDDPVS